MSIIQTLHKVNNEIITIKHASRLCAPHIHIMGASKTQPAATLEEAIKAGLTFFGENRVQEASDKWPELKKRYSQVRLHLIGPLQTNKVKQALGLFDAIQTLDRPRLAEAIAKESGETAVSKQFYIQVNTGEEPQKAGVLPKEADDFIVYCKDELKLPVTGLMCIPPADQPPAPHFALLRKIAQKHGLSELSMGMSDDWQTAIRMGSTCIRLGRALFGERG